MNTNCRYCGAKFIGEITRLDHEMTVHKHSERCRGIYHHIGNDVYPCELLPGHVGPHGGMRGSKFIKQKQEQNVFDQLRKYEADRHNLDELIAMETFGRLVRQGFEGKQIEAPAWLDDTLRAISSEIAVKSRDQLQLRLKEAKARLAVNLSRDERKAQAEADVKRLEQLLNQTPTT